MSEPGQVTVPNSASVAQCKICSADALPKFALPHNKLTGDFIPDEPDDCWYYQCTACDFLFTEALDDSDHSKIYDENYWNEQDPGWYGRVPETMRLVMLANELLKKNMEDLEILDFGCGFGASLDVGRRSLQWNIWGTDIIKPKVGVEHFLSDLNNRSFDIITACEVIEHLPSPWTVFNLIRDHLKSPGVFAFQTAEWDPVSLDRTWWYLGPKNGHISLYSRGSLDVAFTALGGNARRIYRNYAGVQAWLFE